MLKAVPKSNARKVSGVWDFLALANTPKKKGPIPQAHMVIASFKKRGLRALEVKTLKAILKN